MTKSRALLGVIASGLIAGSLTAIALSAVTTVAFAQDYPTRPVRVIIPFPPGGSNDVVGRMIANGLGEKLGKSVIIDNRSGAGGVVGTEVALASPPDGYTLLIVSLAHAVNPWLYPKLNYDPVKSIAPVAIVGAGPIVLVVNPKLPANSVAELLALARKEPGKLNIAHAGIGSFQHLGGSLFLLMSKVDIVQIPFKGGGPSMIDVIAGNSEVMMSSLVQTAGHIKSGKLRALGVGGKKRSPILPDVPTIDEAGVPGYEAVNWWGVVAPAGTPKPIIEKVRAALEGVQDSTSVKEAFAREGADIVKMSTDEFGSFIEAELSKWQKVVKEANIKAE